LAIIADPPYNKRKRITFSQPGKIRELINVNRQYGPAGLFGRRFRRNLFGRRRRASFGRRWSTSSGCQLCFTQ
jgi:hypothetical protein